MALGWGKGSHGSPEGFLCSRSYARPPLWLTYYLFHTLLMWMWLSSIIQWRKLGFREVSYFADIPTVQKWEISGHSVSKPRLFHSTAQPFWVYIFIVFLWMHFYLISSYPSNLGHWRWACFLSSLYFVHFPISGIAQIIGSTKPADWEMKIDSKKKSETRKTWMQKWMQAETDLATIVSLRFQWTAKKDKEKSYFWHKWQSGVGGGGEQPWK